MVKVRHLLLILVIVSLLIQCRPGTTGTAKPNEPPNTTLANIPPPNDPTNPYFALVTLSWDGEDRDGYIVGYKYRYITYHLVRGDSIVFDWDSTGETEKTIPFESSDSINLQKFEVKAIDNEGAEDPTPATRLFYTAMVQTPQTNIIVPNDGDTLFALDYTTDTWPGIKVIFAGSDPDGEVIDFGWQVDTMTSWEWTEDTIIILGPVYFATPLAGTHTIRVKARDNTMVEDLTPAEIHINLVVPSFDKGIIVVDETKDGTGAAENPSDEQVDEFYQSIIERDFTAWDYATEGMPPKTELGKYRLLIWHADDPKDHHFMDHSDCVAEYLNIGGNLWLIGWRILYSFDPNFPWEYEAGSFPYDYLHIKDANEQTKMDFTGAEGVSGYPSIVVDSAKIYPFRKGKLPNIEIMTPGPFEVPILTFNSASADTTFQGKPCAVKYSGTTYNVVFFGFPLFYIRQEEAKALADKVLSAFDE